jgi:signal transduction histidine kinase/DNA-binding response OmpR family regulator/streptogramin lyase
MPTKIYIFLIVFCLPLLFFTGSKAQSLYTIKHLSIKDGLSNNYVKDITQDGQGCIWIATESGLNRFDGHSFTTYTTNNSALLSNELGTALLYDQEENKLWIGTQRNGISILDCSTHQFENFTMENGLVTNDITHLAAASDGGIWITHYHLGVEHYNKKTGKLTFFSTQTGEEPEKPNWIAVEDENGHLLVGHVHDGLSIIDLKTKTMRNLRHDPTNPKSLPGNDVQTIYIDQQKNIWVGTNRGLAFFNPKTEEFICFKHEPERPGSLIANNIYAIREMNDGTLWITSDIGGISILDLCDILFMNPETVNFRNLYATSDDYGLSSGNIKSLMQDSFGNIWIGNYGSGLDFISHTQPLFQTLFYAMKENGITKNKPVWGVFADTENQVWVGSENEITVFKEQKVINTVDFISCLSKPYSHVPAINMDRQGTVWLGLYDEGIWTFNPHNRQFSQIYNLASKFLRLYEETTGKMWIGTEFGLFSYNQGVVQKEDSINNQLPDVIIHSILRDKQGKLWVGTFGRGLCIFDTNNRRIVHLEVSSGFCSNAINHLYMDSEGSVWAATRNGLCHFKDTNHPERFELYDNRQGLKNVHVHAIQEDKAGNIWVSTNDGISFLNKNKQRFNNYDYRDGIPMEHFIAGSTCSTSNGLIYFGSLGGVCCFDPENFTGNRQVAPVQIIECKGFNKQIEDRKEEFLIALKNGTVTLPYHQNSFRILFSVPDYTQNSQVEYAYMIEGLENVWYNTQGENQVTFRNISPGKYMFKVKARLRNHDWDEANAVSMTIHIRPPFWLSWYAKLLYIIFLGLGIFSFLRFYKDKLHLKSSLELERKERQSKQELNDERLRFYTNITHELRTPLTLILGPLEDLQDDQNVPADYNRKINIIHNSALRLLNLINQIMEFRKTETQNRKLAISRDNLSRLVTEIGLSYKEMNRNDKVKFHINIEVKDAILYFDTDIITTVLNNLLSNAVKYTPEGEIRLTLRSVHENGQEFAEIEVADTGYGIDAEALPYIFDRYYQAKGKHQASGTGIGLALVKSLANLHEGVIRVESKAGEGTTFRFLILKENTYPNALRKDNVCDIVETPQLGISTGDENKEDADTRPLLLIVEDNDDIRHYITTYLTSSYKIITASEGKEGLDAALKYIPNIIVSDIMMPVMDGIELCRAIKEDIRTSHIPVILLTAKDTIRDKEDGYESGADSYLTKPFSAKLLQSRINNLLESRRKLAQQIAANTKSPVPDKSHEPVKISKLDEQFLAKLTSLIEENLNMEQLDIPFLTEKLNMSQSTFYRKVKGLTGMSANEFIRKTRLKNSLQLLMTGSYNISEAAYRTGFNHLGYFRECFREEFGMSPSEYLRKQTI